MNFFLNVNPFFFLSLLENSFSHSGRDTLMFALLRTLVWFPWQCFDPGRGVAVQVTSATLETILATPSLTIKHLFSLSHICDWLNTVMCVCVCVFFLLERGVLKKTCMYSKYPIPKYIWATKQWIDLATLYVVCMMNSMDGHSKQNTCGCKQQSTGAKHPL